MSLIFFPMSIGFMSHVDFKKWPCRPVNFKGQGPRSWKPMASPEEAAAKSSAPVHRFPAPGRRGCSRWAPIYNIRQVGHQRRVLLVASQTEVGGRW